MCKTIGYCRVSTKAQVEGNSLEQQSQEILNRYGNAELIIEQYSGAKDDRPKFNKMINELQTNDTIVVTKLIALQNNQRGTYLCWETQGKRRSHTYFEYGINRGHADGGFNYYLTISLCSIRKGNDPRENTNR